MPDESNDEKNQPASPRRREEARERGHVAKSQDLSAAVILLAALITLNYIGQDLVSDLASGMTGIFQSLGELELERDDVGGWAFVAGAFTARLILPILLLLAGAALVIQLAQVGFLYAPDPLAPDLERLDPVAGFGRMFSLRAMMRMAFGIAKLTVLAFVVYQSLRGQAGTVLALSEMEVGGIVRYLIEIAWTVSLRVAIALLILGILEYSWQRYQYEQDLRMSHAEVKEELKRMEGDPRLRERRRQIQRQLATQRMMAAVPKAAVVITNPTHLAVALQYDDTMPAPRLVAKGADLIAEKIRTLAHEHRIPLVERKPLAQAIYHGVDVGQEIPAKLYEAVAEVLAYVYSLKQEARIA